MKVIRSERKDRIVFHFNGSKVFWPSIVWLVDLRMLTGVCKTCLMAPPAIQRILLDNGPSKNSKDIWFLLIVASLQPVLSHALKGCFLFQVFFGRGSNQASLCHARFPLCRCNNRIVSPTMCKMFYTFRREKKHITKKTPIFLLVLFELPRTTKNDVFFHTNQPYPWQKVCEALLGRTSKYLESLICSITPFCFRRLHLFQISFIYLILWRAIIFVRRFLFILLWIKNSQLQSNLTWLHPVGCWKNENHHRWIEGAGPSREAARESRNLSTWTATPGCDAHGAPWREKKRWTKKHRRCHYITHFGGNQTIQNQIPPLFPMVNGTFSSAGAKPQSASFHKPRSSVKRVWTTSFHPSPTW